MATSSITHNVELTSKKAIEQFIQALEQSEKQAIPFTAPSSFEVLPEDKIKRFFDVTD